MWLKGHLASELVYAELLDDLENVHLLAELLATALEQEIVSPFLDSAAEAVGVIEAPQPPEPTILVGEGLATLDLFAHFVDLGRIGEACAVFLHLVEQFTLVGSQQGDPCFLILVQAIFAEIWPLLLSGV